MEHLTRTRHAGRTDAEGAGRIAGRRPAPAVRPDARLARRNPGRIRGPVDIQPAITTRHSRNQQPLPGMPDEVTYRYTRCSPTPGFRCCRPKPATVTTRSSNRSSPTWPTGRSRTCPRVTSTPTRPGSPSPRSPRTRARRRVPGLPVLRQGPRRHHPRGPDQGAGPARPHRPRPPHLTRTPALARRSGLPDPARRRPGARRRSGLTSPDPVTAPPHGPPRPPRPHPRTRRAPQGRSQGGPRDGHARDHLAELLVQRSARK